MPLDEAQDPNVLQELLDQPNIYDHQLALHGEDFLQEIAAEMLKGYESDKQSLEEYFLKQEEWLKIALQAQEEKSSPWPDCSNVKHPQILVASQQFGARAYPALVPGNKIVKHKVIGQDRDNSKDEIGKRLASFVNWQLFHQIDGWEENMDIMLNSLLPMFGTVFKHVYYDDLNAKPAVDLVPYNGLIINYQAKDMMSAYRKTRELEYTANEVEERIRAGIFSPHALRPADQEPDEVRDSVMKTHVPTDNQDKASVHKYVEIHSWADLDDDGYEEPWIFTINCETVELVWIKARFDAEGLQVNDRGEIKRILPVEHFIRYGFLPNPVSNIYYLGFNTLLGPLTESMNTIINQTIDNGTLNNLSGGFIHATAGLKAAEYDFIPGEYLQVKTSVDDIRKAVMPLPVNPPSSVLFSFLGFLEQQTQNISTVKDIMMGENPGQNQKATTTLAVIEQGQKTFSSIYKRVYRSLDIEVKAIQRINKKYITDVEYFEVLDDAEIEQPLVVAEDFAASVNLKLVADPILSTESLRLARAQALLELLPLGLNVDEVKRRILEAQDHPNIEALLAVQPTQPSVEEQLAVKELELKEREVVVKEKTLLLEAMKIAQESKMDEDRLRLDAANSVIEALSKSHKSMTEEESVHAKRSASKAVPE